MGIGTDYFSFVIWVTSACNLACSYCYEGDKKKPLNMTLETADKTVDFIIDYIKKRKIEVCRIVFHGGEPTINIKAIQVIRNKLSMFCGCEFSYEITTNGYMVSSSTLDFLIDNIDYITVSVDGNKTMHNLCRKSLTGSGSYKNAIKTALRIKMKHPVRIRMTVNSKNYIYLYEGIKSLLDYGFKEIIPAIDVFDEALSEGVFASIQDSFQRIKEYLKWTKNDSYVAYLNVSEIQKIDRCQGGINSIHIYVDERLFPCTYLVDNYEFEIGSLDDGVNYHSLNELDENNNCDVEECKGCEYLSYCSTSRCKYLNKMITGFYNKAVPSICANERLRLRLNK